MHPTRRDGSQGPDARDPRLWPVWRFIWPWQARWGGWGVHGFVLLAFLVIIGGGYEAVVRFNAARAVTVWSPVTQLDYHIPTIPWSIIPYVTHYLYFVLALAVSERTERGARNLLLLFQALLIATTISFAFFVAFPCEIIMVQQLPEDLLRHTGWPGRIYGVIHGLDKPYNAWPSLHVSQSMLIVLYATRLHRRPILNNLLWIAWMALAISTLTTKQHFLFDVLTAIVLGAAVWKCRLSPFLWAAGEPATPLEGRPRSSPER